PRVPGRPGAVPPRVRRPGSGRHGRVVGSRQAARAGSVERPRRDILPTPPPWHGPRTPVTGAAAGPGRRRAPGRRARPRSRRRVDPRRPAARADVRARPAEVLRLRDVDFVRQGHQLLSDIAVTVRAGERWALIGTNGAGKSTLLSLCAAEAHPTRGTVEVLGHRLGRVEIRKLRESIGHVNPRHPLRSPLTVREVVLTGATGTTDLMGRWEPDADTLARADRLIEVLGLEGLRAATWPTMSQGERGRALIARALLPNPALLLLDEPSTGLDV